MNRTRAEEDASEDAPAPWGVVECAIPGGVLALVITWELTCPPNTHDNLIPRIVTCVAFLLVVAYLLNRLRRRGLKELSEVRAVARATQAVLLRPLPARLDGLAFYARQLSVSRAAEVGGDLYEAVATAYGVRVIIGDVRGHGLPSIGAVAAVLGSFREAAHDEPGLDGVLRRLDRAHQRHLRARSGQETAGAEERARGRDGSGTTGPDGGPGSGPGSGGPAAGGFGSGASWPGGGGSGGRESGGRESGGWGYDDRDPEGLSAEEFVTVLLLEIGHDAEVRALNCGHPWPYRLGRGAVPLASAEPLPPLGAFPLPVDLPLQRCGPLLPGESLFLHTDGAEDARDSAGRFFGLAEELAGAAEGISGVPLSPTEVVRRVHGALLRHTGGRITDDMALLVVRNDRAPVPVPGPVPVPTPGPVPVPVSTQDQDQDQERAPDPDLDPDLALDPEPGAREEPSPPEGRTPDHRSPGVPPVSGPSTDEPSEGQLPGMDRPDGPRAATERPPGSRAPDGQAPDGCGLDTYSLGQRPPDTYVPKTHPPEQRPPETYAPEQRPPDTYPSDMYPKDMYPPGTYPPGTYPPDAHAPEQRLPDPHAPEQRPRLRPGMTATGVRTTSFRG
ncbi:SpoIIE family protein phosphatase [Streptomyces sp. NPDC055025]